MDLNDFHGLKIERLVSVCISSYIISKLRMMIWMEDDSFLFSGILLQFFLPLWAFDRLENTVVFLIVLLSSAHRDLDKATILCRDITKVLVLNKD